MAGLRNPYDWRDILENYSERDIRREYSRLRSIINKRVQRLAAAGITNNFVAYNAGTYLPIKLIQPTRGKSVARILAEEIVRANYAIDSKGSTLRGHRETERRRDEGVELYARDRIYELYGGKSKVPKDVLKAVEGVNGRDIREVFGIVNTLFKEYIVPSDVVIDAWNENVLEGMVTRDIEDIALRALLVHEADVRNGITNST